MPYYRHPKDLSPERVTEMVQGDELVPFATMVLAREGLDPKVEAVTFVPSETERETWREREANRFDSGEYLKCPWFMGSRYRDNLPLTRDHYVHLSVSHPGLVAYTKSEEHGVQDRQTRIKPGKYLEEFYRDTYTDAQIADFVAQCKAEYLELRIARTEADIVAIYASRETGFTSCMQCKDDSEYDWQRAFENGYRPHPCAVYGESDLGVAYLGELGAVRARAVVWPDEKRYTRAYGDTTLIALLRQAGYEPVSSLTGARIRAINHNGDYVMPYIDGSAYVKLSADRQWFTLVDESTRYHCDSAEGYACGSSDDVDGEDDDADDPDLYTCEHCNCDYDYDEQENGELNRQWCDRCLDRSFVCDCCNERRFNDPATVMSGEMWCETCIEANTSTCEHCNSELLWCEDIEFTRAEHETRETLGTTHLCRTCSGFEPSAVPVQSCRSCGHLFDYTEPACLACGMAVRCASTLDLLTVALGVDGSIWWAATDPAHPLPAIRWIAWPDGRRAYSYPPYTEFSFDTQFDTLDDTTSNGGYHRVPDPRTIPMESPF